jgi:rhodanese-related sulfurtransferase
MKSSRIIFAVLVAAAGLIAAMAVFTHPGPPAPSAAAPNAVTPGRVLPIDVAALQRLMRMDPNLVLIDVREPAERSGPLGSIPRSLNIPMKRLTASLDKLPEGKTLVFICRSGPRSRDAARKAAAAGLTSYYVQGGMVAWRRMQHPKGDEKRPAAPSPATPEQGPEETPFFGRDLGC